MNPVTVLHALGYAAFGVLALTIYFLVTFAAGWSEREAIRALRALRARRRQQRAFIALCEEITREHAEGSQR